MTSTAMPPHDFPLRPDKPFLTGRPRRILLATGGRFDENLRYQEVVQTRVLARHGHHVTVICAEHVPEKNPPPGCVMSRRT